MQTVLPTLRRYIADTLLEGDDGELDESTPLLEWGVIDSIAMVDLLAFIERELGVRIPDEDVMPENFATLSAIGHLVSRRLESR
jgi:acyl carrier protein